MGSPELKLIVLWLLRMTENHKYYKTCSQGTKSQPTKAKKPHEWNLLEKHLIYPSGIVGRSPFD